MKRLASTDAVMAAGGKGISQMQRYEGLGDLNPEQVWGTMLDRNVRFLQPDRDHQADR